MYVKNTINPTQNIEYMVPSNYDGDGSVKVKMYASSGHLKGEVVHYFFDATGGRGFHAYAGTSGSEPYGVCQEAIASGEYGWVVVRGMAYGARTTKACTATGWASMEGYAVIYDTGLNATANSTLSSGITSTEWSAAAAIGILMSTYNGSDASTDYGYMVNIYLPQHSVFA
jgi:hypothetical protein